MLKRSFDIIFSTIGLIMFSPLLLIIAILIKKEDGGLVFYRGLRVGRYGKPFKIFKFRTMNENSKGPGVTLPDDGRVTKFGQFLRRYKIDEWPQLFNVVKGEMSIIGPRPELPCYVEKYPDNYRKILSTRPGISDPASIAFRNETNMLRSMPEQEAEKYYLETLLPKKIKMNEDYINNMSFFNDILIILRSVIVVFERTE